MEMKSLAGAFPKSEAGLEPSLPISQDSSHPGLDSCASVWVKPQQEVGTFMLSLSPSLPAAFWVPVPWKRPGLGYLTPWPVFSIQLTLSALSFLLGEMA